MTDPFIARTRDQLATGDRVLSMSGLEFMRAMAEGRQPLPPIAGPMNYRLESVEDGRVVFRGTPQFQHVNPMGFVHGGWYGTLLDSAMGCAVMTRLPVGCSYTTLEYKVNITRAIPPDTPILAIGIAQHVGRSTGVANGEIRGADDDRLYATGSTTCIVLQAG